MNRLTNSAQEPLTLTLKLTTTHIVILGLLAILVTPHIKFWVNLTLILYLAFILASLLRQLTKKSYKALIKLNPKFKRFITERTLATVWFALTFITFWALFFNLAVQVINQTSLLINQFLLAPQTRDYVVELAEKLVPLVSKEVLLSTVGNFFTSLLSFQNALNSAKGTISAIPYVIFIFFATWYILIDRDTILNTIAKFLPTERSRQKLQFFTESLDRTIGRWARAQFLLMLIIGFVTYIALLILKVPYPLPLAVLAGLLEVVPTFGPLLSAIPAALIGLATGGISKMLIILAAYFIIQQLENSLIVPKVMQSLTGLHPLVTVLIITIGQSLFGPLGAVLSIPIYISIMALIQAQNEFAKIYNDGSNK